MTDGPSQLKPTEVIDLYFEKRGYTAISKRRVSFDPVVQHETREHFKLELPHPRGTHPPLIAASISVVMRPHVQHQDQGRVLDLEVEQLDTVVMAEDVSVLLFQILEKCCQAKVNTVKLDDM